MPATLLIQDETATGAVEHSFALEVEAERITARELIRRRVEDEVERYNAKRIDPFRGLIQPTDTERTLNGFKFREKKGRIIDAEAQVARAFEAFEANQIIMLVNDQQVESLDAEIDLGGETRVSFLRLVPLVGG